MFRSKKNGLAPLNSPIRNIELSKKILEFIAASRTRVTPADLEKTLARRFAIRRGEIRKLVRALVSEGELAYVYDYGRTFIEASYNKPVRVSAHVVLKPPRITWASSPGDIVIELLHGESFGTGRHATTRLSLMAIEEVMRGRSFFEAREKSAALDIGTGSGVLAIAAVKFGFQHALGTDIDACARNEARKNALLNGLEKQIEIRATDLEPFNQAFTLVTANLRCPTIMQLCPAISRILALKSAVIISGIKTDEVDGVLKVYARENFSCAWSGSQKGWAGLVLLRSNAS